MLVEHGFDLAEFYPVAANFDLMIHSTQDFNITVRKIPREVASTIGRLVSPLWNGSRMNRWPVIRAGRDNPRHARAPIINSPAMPTGNGDRF